jgi:hypothetical protein
MSDVNVVAFPSRLHNVEVEQALCPNCESRAMRLVSDDCERYGFDVECHNCGNEMEGLKVIWEHGSDT